MSLAAAFAALALWAAAPPACTVEDVRTARVPPQIAWQPAVLQHDVPVDQHVWFFASLGPKIVDMLAADFRWVALPKPSYQFAFFSIRGETMKLHMCRPNICYTGYDGPRRAISWLGTFTEGMPDVAFDRAEVRVYNRGRYRRVCNVRFRSR